MSGYVVLLEPEGKEVDPELLGKMTGAMTNRGPDGEHCWRGGRIGYGLAWLRTGNGPTARPPLGTLDRRTWIVGDIRIDEPGRVADSSPLIVGQDRFAGIEQRQLRHAHRSDYRIL